MRDRTVAAIIDSAAVIMATQGDGASMSRIADAAGVGRATLYRYFPSREALLRAMAAQSVEELAARIADADLEGIPAGAAIARLARGFIAVGSKYTVLTTAGIQRSGEHPDIDARLVEPIRALFRRGAADGSLRADLPADVMADLFSGLIRAALQLTADGRAGVEEASAAVVSVFLDGARAGGPP
ncbi:TetR/AcrR family transcriptional regulator [Dactylosporangium vinaceum]